MKRGRQDFCEDVGVVVACGDVADTHEGVAGHFAERKDINRESLDTFSVWAPSTVALLSTCRVVGSSALNPNSDRRMRKPKRAFVA